MRSVPLAGTPNENIFYGAYYAHGLTDYNCGIKAFEGHRGVDILLRNFLVQDSGVVVEAVAPGRVVAAVDGQFDRNAVRPSPGGFGNHLEILHDESRFSHIYAHLRENSLMVDLGDEVRPGDPLGLVGSSGNSNWPHLHFEVRDDFGIPVDPYEGPCSATEQLWTDPLPYQDEFHVLDVGITTTILPSLEFLLERPVDDDVISTDEPLLLFWVETHNINADSLRFDVRDPSNQLALTTTFPQRSTFSVTFVTVTLAVEGMFVDPGVWTITFSHAPIGEPMQEVLSRQFELVPASGVAGRALPVGIQQHGVVRLVGREAH